MSDHQPKDYIIQAMKPGHPTMYHNVRGGSKGIRLVEQLEADGWTCAVQVRRSEHRRVTRRRKLRDED